MKSSVRIRLLAAALLSLPAPLVFSAPVFSGDTYPYNGANDISFIGYSGVGNATLNDGTSNSDQYFTLGSDTSGVGTLTVSGLGSVWAFTGTTYADTIGGSGSGTLSITDYGQLIAPYISMASDAGATGVLNVTTHGRLTITTSLQVGANSAVGTATVNVLSGGQILNNATGLTNAIGAYGQVNTAPAPATVTISGAGSQWTGNSSMVMDSDSSLTVADGGLLALSGSGSNGALTLRGTASTETATALLVTGVNSLVALSGNFLSGQQNTVSTLTVADGGKLRVGGSFTISNTTLNIGTGSTSDPGTLDTSSIVCADPLNYSPLPSVIVFNHDAARYLFANDAGTGIGLGGPISVHIISGTTVFIIGSSYTLGTTIDGGTLLADNTAGSALGTGAVIVNTTGTLGGFGIISGATTIKSGAHLAPGDGGGTLTFTAGLALNNGSILDLQLGTTSDKILITGGTLSGDAGGLITINLTDSGGFTGGTFDLIDATSASLSNIDASDFALGTTLTGYDYSIAMDGNVLQLTATASAIPEPAAYAALLGALVLVLALRQRRTALRH